MCFFKYPCMGNPTYLEKTKKSQVWLQRQGFWFGVVIPLINWLLSTYLHLTLIWLYRCITMGCPLCFKKMQGKHNVTFWDTFEIMYPICCNPFWQQSRGHKTAIEGKIHWIPFCYRGATCLETHPLYRMGRLRNCFDDVLKQKHIVGSQTYPLILLGYPCH